MNSKKLIVFKIAVVFFFLFLFIGFVFSSGFSSSRLSNVSSSSSSTLSQSRPSSSSQSTAISKSVVTDSQSILIDKLSSQDYPEAPFQKENVIHFDSLSSLHAFFEAEQLANSYDAHIPLWDNQVLYPPEEYISREDYISLLYSSAKNTRSRESYNESLSSVPNFWGTAPTTGEYSVPVFLMEFTDIPHTFDVNYYNDLFNSDNFMGNDGISVSKYFNKQSYGDLNITFDIYDWVSLNGPRGSYSGPNMFDIVLDTFSIHHNLGTNLSQYDSIGNNRLDGAIIIISGPYYTIPYHTRILKEYTTHSFGGYYLGNTAIINEKIDGVQCNSWINVYDYPSDCRTSVIHNTHEFAHILGLPDLYGINPETGAAHAYGYGTGGLGNWDMMTSTRLPMKPINLSAWSRYFLGWLEPKFIGTFGPTYAEHEDLCQNTTVALRSYSHYPDAVILSNYYGDHMNDREFFLTVNRYADLDDPNNLDNSTVSLSPNSSNPHLGLETWHVDEAYIEANYLTNSIMWDSDQAILLDCYIIETYYSHNPDLVASCGRPGLVPEDNRTCSNQPMSHGPSSYRTSTVITYDNNDDGNFYDWSLAYFDRYMRLEDVCAPYIPRPIIDSISNSYNLTWDTKTSIRALDPSGFTIRGRFSFQECYGDPFCAVREFVHCPLER